MKENKYLFNDNNREIKKHIYYVDVSIHHDFSPRPCSDTEPIIVYGTFLSSSFEVCMTEPLLLGISFGAVSSKISCTTRNLKIRIEFHSNQFDFYLPNFFPNIHNKIMCFIISFILPCPCLFSFNKS